jgi:hypothetical protein
MCEGDDVLNVERTRAAYLRVTVPDALCLKSSTDPGKYLHSWEDMTFKHKHNISAMTFSAIMHY